MAEILPGTLFRSKRGICPTCGAALQLKESGRFVACSFCGCESTVERRLRKLDANVDGAEFSDESEERASDTRALARALGKSQPEEVQCPGCGSIFSGDAAHDIQRCTACGTQSKIERRMVRRDAEPRVPPQRRNRADLELQSRGNSPLKWDVETEQLCWRVLNEKDPLKQIALAGKFQSWGYVNATLVYFLPHLLQLARDKGPVLAVPLLDCVGKLLCQEDQRLHGPTIEACEPFALDPNGPPEVLDEIALGNARGLKLLLDAADVAARGSDMLRAARACWGASTMIDRNYDQHPVIAEIILYRMFYLSPAVLGWVLYLFESGTGGYVFKDWRQVLEFADDCAFEARDLVGIVAKRAWPPQAKSLADLDERIAFTNARHSKAGKAAALDKLFLLEDDAPDPVWERAVSFVEPGLDDADLLEAATARLREFARHPSGLKPAVIELIKRRGHTLPEIVQRQVHWTAPGNKLLDPEKIPRYYNPPPDPPWPPRVQSALDLYREAIRATVDQRDEASDECRAMWKKAEKLEVRVFNGRDDEPATAGELPPPPPTREEAEEAQAQARAERAQVLAQRAAQRYSDIVQQLQARGKDVMSAPEFQQAQREMDAINARVDAAARLDFRGTDTFEDELGVPPPPLQEPEPDTSPQGLAQAEYMREVQACQEEMAQAMTRGGNMNEEIERITARMQRAVEKLTKRMQEIAEQG